MTKPRSPAGQPRRSSADLDDLLARLDEPWNTWTTPPCAQRLALLGRERHRSVAPSSSVIAISETATSGGIAAEHHDERGLLVAGEVLLQHAEPVALLGEQALHQVELGLELARAR